MLYAHFCHSPGHLLLLLKLNNICTSGKDALLKEVKKAAHSDIQYRYLPVFIENLPNHGPFLELKAFLDRLHS